jgi:hypothetical protein
MKKFILIICAFLLLHYILKANITVKTTHQPYSGSANFSHCTLQEHQSITGPLIAHNANLKSASVTGRCELKDSKVEHLEVCGPLSCTRSEIQKLHKTGLGKLVNSQVTDHFESTGLTHAAHCEFKSYAGSGNLECDHVEVDATLKNIGQTVLSHSSVHDAHITGLTSCEHATLVSCTIIGKTTFTETKVSDLADICGMFSCERSTLKKAIVCGKTHLKQVSAAEAEITGQLTAELSNIKTVTLKTDESYFDSCAIETLYVEKNDESTLKRPITIKIANSHKNTPGSYIKRIVCSDPTTIIIYTKNAIQADEVVGTTHITVN